MLKQKRIIYIKYSVYINHLNVINLFYHEESEVSKYYSNSFFASLISFSNQFAQLCDNLPNCDLERSIKLYYQIKES